MSYTPRRGSTVDAMLAALQRVDGMTSAELAAGGGVRTKAISALMAGAVKAGWVDKTIAGKRVRYRWRDAYTVLEKVPKFTRQLPTERAFWGVPAPSAGGEAEQLPAEREEDPPAEREDDPPAEGSFAVALWHDGELDIFGAGEIEQNGVPGVRLNRDQVVELRRMLFFTPRASACSVADVPPPPLSPLQQRWLSEFQQIRHAAFGTERAKPGNRS